MARILIADSHEADRTTLSRLLENEGYLVSVVPDGQSVIHALDQQQDIDSIIIAFDIPLVNGLQVIRVLKGHSAYRDIPLILVLSDAEQNSADVGNILQAGVEDFITKPYDAFEVLIRLKVMLKLKDNFAQLRSERDFIRSLVENMGALLIVTTPDGNILTFNRTAQEFLEADHGWQQRPLNLFEAMYRDEAYRSEIRDAYSMYLELKREHFELETTLKSGDKEHLIRWQITPVFDHSRRNDTVIHVGHDITSSTMLTSVVDSLAADLKLKNLELDRINNELTLQNIDLQRLNHLKDSFLSIVSHDLRSPLNAILGFSDLMLNSKLDERQERMIRKVKLAGEQQLNLINDLLDIAKIEAGGIDVEYHTLILENLLQDCAENFESLAQGKDITIELPQPDSPVKLTADGPKLQQVFNNLLSNAIKFTPQGGKVSIAIAKNSDHVAISVKDNGVGISQERVSYLFNRLKRSSTTGTHGEKGTGLGLTICKALVEAHGGSISVESELNHGTAFNIQLPLKPDPERKKVKLDV